MLTKDSHISEVYANPIGKDIIHRVLLQMGRSDKLVDNAIVGSLKLKSLPRLSGGKLDEGFVDTLITLLNGEKDVPREDNPPESHAWWKEAVFYQIYPRSFKDSNNDGIGDLNGIIEKLDYLKELGVDAIWLSPIYDSPNDDNGYDIRDYHKIMNEFGTIEDFDRLLEGIHSRGMHLIMDLVVNHTSDEHEWFKKALEDPSSPYGDYYIFRDKPNNWTSFFSGSAWNYYPERNQYALHLFSKKQMDLNWENFQVRQQVCDMVRWWLDKGVDGFRMDVINYISKHQGLPDGNVSVGMLMGFTGVENYFYGPRLHEYLRELKKDAFAPYNAFSVGETPGVGMEMSKLLTADYRQELDMVFSFDHLETPGHTRYDDYKYDLNCYKVYMIDWMENYGSHCQPSLFFENHDNPRMVSKVNPDPAVRNVLAKLLGVMQMTLKGTPFIFQGQELGMVNQPFTSINDLRDVEALNMYKELVPKIGEQAAWNRILAGTRDHARTPMQWTAGKNAGFTEGEPWIPVSSDCKKCNANQQVTDKASVWNFYKELMALRKSHNAFTYGVVDIVDKKKKDMFTYYRRDENEEYYIECYLGSLTKKRSGKMPKGQLVLSNYKDLVEEQFRPYEAHIWKIK